MEAEAVHKPEIVNCKYVQGSSRKNWLDYKILSVDWPNCVFPKYLHRIVLFEEIHRRWKLNKNIQTDSSWCTASSVRHCRCYKMKMQQGNDHSHQHHVQYHGILLWKVSLTIPGQHSGIKEFLILFMFLQPWRNKSDVEGVLYYKNGKREETWVV
jgi:hypothetical protein